MFNITYENLIWHFNFIYTLKNSNQINLHILFKIKHNHINFETNIINAHKHKYYIVTNPSCF